MVVNMYFEETNLYEKAQKLEKVVGQRFSSHDSPTHPPRYQRVHIYVGE